MFTLFSTLCLLLAPSGLLGEEYDPDELISTPIGYRPRKCVHTPEEKNHLLTHIDNGTWVEYPDSKRKVFHPRLQDCVDNANELKRKRDRRLKQMRQFSRLKNELGDFAPELDTEGEGNVGDGGWYIDGGYYTPSIMGYFSSEIYIPDENPTNQGQILYYFIGLQDNSDNNLTILQPVVAYCPNGCGWSYTTGWSGAAWNCCPSGQSWYGPGVSMQPGDSVSNYVSANDYQGNCAISLTLDRTGEKSQLFLSSDYRQYNWACITLEAYDYSDCSAFNSKPFYFDSMVLTTQSGQSINEPQWSSGNSMPNCGGSLSFSNNNLDSYIIGTS